MREMCKKNKMREMYNLSKPATENIICKEQRIALHATHPALCIVGNRHLLEPLACALIHGETRKRGPNVRSSKCTPNCLGASNPGETTAHLWTQCQTTNARVRAT